MRSVTANHAEATTPKLKPVTLLPVARRVAPIRHPPRRRRLHPRGRHKLFPVPHSFLKVKLPKLRNVLRADAQAKAAHRHALLASFPLRIFDPERRKQPRLQICQHRLPGHRLHDGRLQVRRRRVVGKKRSRLVRYRQREKPFHDALLRQIGKSREVLRVLPRRHREEIAHAHRLEIRTGLRRRLLREEFQHRIVHA